VNYSRADASLVSFEGDLLLDAGASPPPGVQIFYYLRRAPADDLDLHLDILDLDGSVVRSFAADTLHAAAGLNRFVWNMRYAGVPDVEKVGNLDPWERTDGPMVLPSVYRVRLTIGSAEVDQEFELLADPRLGDRVAELPAQLQVLRDIYARLTRCNELINKITRLEDQVASLHRWRSPVPTSIDDLSTTLVTLEERLIDVNMSRAQLHASGLHEKLNALIEFVDSGDYAPAQQARDVFAELEVQLEDVTNQFDTAVQNHLPALSRLIAEAMSGAAMIPV
jgi:hypothetical protein